MHAEPATPAAHTRSGAMGPRRRPASMSTAVASTPTTVVAKAASRRGVEGTARPSRRETAESSSAAGRRLDRADCPSGSIVRKSRRRVPREFADLAGHLHAGRSPADHDECEPGGSRSGSVLLCFGGLEGVGVRRRRTTSALSSDLPRPRTRASRRARSTSTASRQRTISVSYATSRGWQPSPELR